MTSCKLDIREMCRFGIRDHHISGSWRYARWTWHQKDGVLVSSKVEDYSQSKFANLTL
jgi:hypothetical protein